MFYNSPRIHFNGIYVCKHQYKKEEERNLLTNTGMVSFVYYYRYFRFFSDGSVISAVFTQKQKLETIADIMTKNVINDNTIDQSLMLG